jgi:predicted phosphodiesterase
MSTFVFSDSHLYGKVNKRKLDKLKSLIEKADNVIINGDFWEGLIITFDEFMESDWKELFPLLKAKHTVYVFGNHDHKGLSDDRIYQFCDLAVHEYELKTPKHTYFFTHGAEFLYPRQADVSLLKREHPKQEAFMTDIQRIIFSIFGPHVLPKSFNFINKEERQRLTSLDNILVCGHTHRPQYQKDLNFIDLGFFNYGYANYLLIDNEGNFEIKCERY